MTLVLEIEHLLGVAYAAHDQGSGTPDWPPQPDRVFSALVASWGARGEREAERHALEWLEWQPCPEITATNGFPRTAPIVFVPPNDAEGGRVGNAAVLPSLRRRQARHFPAFRPDNPVVLLIWRDVDPDPETVASLNALAADTAYVGHSASLTRCRFRGGEPADKGVPARRRVYRGRLAELEREFHATPLKRPSPGTPVRAAPTAEPTPADGWLVLEHFDGEMPDIRGAALAAKALRNTLMAGYREIGLGAAIPSKLSGHSADGKPSTEPHLGITPLAFLGWPYASGAVLGFALVPPRGELFADPEFQRAIRAITSTDGSRRLLRLDSAGLHLTLAIGTTGERRSLDPTRYLGAARVWASCTPIVLDRHLKAAGNEAREQEITDSHWPGLRQHRLARTRMYCRRQAFGHGRLAVGLSVRPRSAMAALAFAGKPRQPTADPCGCRIRRTGTRAGDHRCRTLCRTWPLPPARCGERPVTDTLTVD